MTASSNISDDSAVNIVIRSPDDHWSIFIPQCLTIVSGLLFCCSASYFFATWLRSVRPSRPTVVIKPQSCCLRRDGDDNISVFSVVTLESPVTLIFWLKRMLSFILLLFIVIVTISCCQPASEARLATRGCARSDTTNTCAVLVE